MQVSLPCVRVPAGAPRPAAAAQPAPADPGLGRSRKAAPPQPVACEQLPQQPAAGGAGPAAAVDLQWVDPLDGPPPGLGLEQAQHRRYYGGIRKVGRAPVCCKRGFLRHWLISHHADARGSGMAKPMCDLACQYGL